MINQKKINPNTQFFWDKKVRARSKIYENDYITKDRIKYIAKSIPSNTSVLDIGFGYGFLEQELANMKLKVKLFGIDISEVAVRRLARQSGNFFIVAKAGRIPFKEKSFDVICLLEVLEHVFNEEKDLILKEIYRLLKSNGKLIVSVPLFDPVFKNHPSGHVRVYSPKKLVSELSVSRFKILRKKFLYAFSSNYSLKNWVCSVLRIKQPNNLIVIATKR
jgi:2-polyprenyl-3-methyl-5-hydroxy-6-metoxy-1,4-benzoquinol methylase